MTKQQQQQPQGPQVIKCEGCGGTSLFDKPIADPRTGITHHTQRCRDCGRIRWPGQ